jgi:hypothetical protein
VETKNASVFIAGVVCQSYFGCFDVEMVSYVGVFAVLN